MSKNKLEIDVETAERIAQEFGIEPSTSSNTKFN